MLESLARDVTGWDAKAVEFFSTMVTTQYLNHLRTGNQATTNLRDAESLEKISLIPFNNVSHFADIRNISKRRGYYNIPNIGIFLLRIQALPGRNAPAYHLGEGKYTFNRLGYDEPLYNHSISSVGPNDVAAERNISAPIRRQILNNSLDDYYFSSANNLHLASVKQTNPDRYNRYPR